MEETLFKAYKAALEAHIRTKTVDSVFHAKSEEFYDVLFECFHSVGERLQDTGKDSPMDLKQAVKSTLDSLEEAKSFLENEVNGKSLSVGTDNLYRSLIDKLENAIGNAKAFHEEAEEEGLDIDDHLEEEHAD